MKKILSVILLLAIVFCTSIYFTGCVANSADEAKAKNLALSEAKKFTSNLHKTTYKSAEVTNIKYSGGTYIVDVDAKVEINVIYSLEVEATYPITYKIKVVGGTAKVKDVVYHEMELGED